MKSEYLITFDSKDGICTSIEKFKNLLAAHASISFGKKEKIGFKWQEILVPVSTGKANGRFALWKAGVSSGNQPIRQRVHLPELTPARVNF